jgi:TPR repeat protein
MNNASDVNEKLKIAKAAFDDLNFKEALPLLLELADQSVPEACMDLGYLYKYGNEDIQADEQLSSFWYSKYFFLLKTLSNQGDHDAAFELACCYQYGDNIRCDEKKAVELYTNSATEGHAKSQFHLSSLWRYGWCGLPKNAQMFLYWLKEAVIAGYPEALYTKGLLSLDEACPEQNAEGLVLVNRSADLGFWPAVEFLKRKARSNKN